MIIVYFAIMDDLTYHFEVAFDHSELTLIFKYYHNTGFEVDL
jgi:hypothetical protein